MKGDFTRWTFTPEKHYHGVLKQQGRVDLDADWNEQGAIVNHRVETETVDVIGRNGAPAGNAGFLVTASGANVTITKGRAYVDGLLCENEQNGLPITAQPDLPGFKLPATAGFYIAYLKVWQRHIIALDDGGIREDALGGPDTCTRSKTVWQVKLLQPGTLTGNLDCSSRVQEWEALLAGSTGKLTARAEPDPTSADPCLIPAKAGYRRLENQLYRVEIHDGGKPGGQATFKWSRDNGSIVTSWTGKTGDDLAVTSTGRDNVLGFAAGQWVELTDDTHDLNFQPGTLVQLGPVKDNTLTIKPGTAIGSVNFADFPLNPKVRRWDSVGRAAVGIGPWLNLEDGVQVQFSDGIYATGDYWLIPARTLKGDVEWPEDGSGNPLPQSPKGIRVHYCKLAVLLYDGKSWSVTASCLPVFPPLTAIAGTAPDDGPGIHVMDVRLLGHGFNLQNDSDIPLALLNEGIGIFCDAAVAPHSIQRATYFVAVEMPLTDVGSVLAGTGISSVIGYQPLILAAGTSLSTDSRVIQWKVATPAILSYLQDALVKLQAAKQDARLLTHLTLKGNYIWGPDDKTAASYLDGEVFAIPRQDDANTTRIGLKLPRSGDGRRGGDFEMWFWLTLPVTLAALTFNPNSVIVGQNSTGSVTLSGSAPAGGALVALAANNSSLATIPTSVTILAGQNTASFPVTKTALSPGNATDLFQVTGTYLQSQAKGSLTINMAPPR